MNDIQKIRKANLFRVIYVGLCLMTVFTAFASGQNLAGQIYIQLGYGNLGQICLLLVWGTLALMSAIAPHYMKKMSPRTGLIIGAAAHGSFIIAGGLTTFCAKYGYQDGVCSSSFIYCFNIFCACLVGIGASFFWLCQGIYVDSCADQQTKGFYNGIFWSIFQTSQILSSSLATYTLGRTDQFTFYMILVAFSILSIVMLLFMKPAVIPETKLVQTEAQETISNSLRKFIDLIQNSEYHFFFTGTFFSGVAIATYITFLGSAARLTIESENINEINEKIGYVLIALAVGEILAGFSIGRFADKYDKLKVFKITMLINEAAAIMTIIACLFKSYTFAIISGFLWGYGESSIQTMLNAVIGYMFEGRIELFSANKFFQTAGFVYTALLCVLLSNIEPRVFITLIALSLFGLHLFYSKLLPKVNKEPTDDISRDDVKLVRMDKL